MTRNDEEFQRLRRAFASTLGSQEGTGSCAETGLIWEAATGELPAGRVREIGLHVVGCPACRQAWQLARELVSEAAAEGVEIGAPQPVRTASRTSSWTLLLGGATALAAAALLLLFVILPDGPADRSPATRFRTGPEELIRSLVPAEEPLPRDDFVLRWEGPEGARYSLRVAGEDLRVIHRVRDIGTTWHKVPQEKLADLPEGAAVLWQVEAVLPGDGTLTSITFTTSVR